MRFRNPPFHNLLIWFACVLAISCSKTSSPTNEASGVFAYPAGVYGLGPGTSFAASSLSQSAGVVGMFLNWNWNQVDLSTDANHPSYLWDTTGNQMDTEIASLSAQGLKVALKITASPLTAPTYVVNGASQNFNSYYTSGTTCAAVNAPAFFDPFYHAQKKKMIEAAGAHFANNPAVIAVVGSFANFETDDWNVPHSSGTCNNVSYSNDTAWQSIGYTHALMLQIGEDILTTTATAFPNQAIKLPIQVTDATLDGTSTQLAQDILSYAYSSETFGKRFFAQINFLHGNSPTACQALTATPGTSSYIFTLIADYAPQIGIQFASSAADDTSNNCRENGFSPCPASSTLQNAETIALSYQPRFIEVWQIDATDSSILGFQTINTTATQALQSTTPASVNCP